MKATAIAPSNIAFIKYWGRKDERLRLPSNGSISMNLSALRTKTTVEFDRFLTKDKVVIDKETIEGKDLEKLQAHLNRIRKLAGVSEKAYVKSSNTFPKSTGLSSSASGFAALTFAATKALGLQLSEKELSILSRLGSGSACRSIPDGFVEWLDGETSETSYGVSLFDENHWDIVDVVCILSSDQKDVPTSKGQTFANTSPFFPLRLGQMNEKIRKTKEALYEKNFKLFGEIIESEALEMHAIMITSRPSLLYWHPNTLSIMKKVQSVRREGLPVYFTLNTGHNIHLITQKKNIDDVLQVFENDDTISEVLVNHPAKGARITDE